MVTLIEKKIGRKRGYWLRHRIRIEGKSRNIEKFLGYSKPKNLEEEMLKFFREIYREKYKEIEELRKEWLSNLKKLPRPILEKEMHNFGIKFTYSTNKIEGSTLSLRDTLKILEFGITPERKPLRDVKETENHMKVFLEMLKLKKRPNLSLILEWHYKIFKDTKPEIAGKIRNYQVRISGSKFLPPPPVELNPLLKDFFRWLDRSWNKLHAVELAALSHLKLVTIHPFGDGSGRVSRLLMNYVLWQKRYPLVIIPYERRDSYYSALERSQVSKNEFIFLVWFIRNYKKFSMV